VPDCRMIDPQVLHYALLFVGAAWAGTQNQLAG
jgi:hypothetical protein